jgi:phospholipid transport system substrate-binding protein
MRSSNRRGPALAALAALLLLPLPAAAADDAAAQRRVIEQTTSDVLAVLADDAFDADAKRDRIEAIVYAQVDFETVSRLVLARNWQRFSEPQQREFREEFKRHLSRTYGRNIDNYKNERVEIVGDRAEARGDWTVRTKVVRTGGSEDIAVDYRLRRRDGVWRIIDIIVEGVSLIANFRSQFQEIVAQDGPDHLLELLRSKNLKSEPIT